MTQITGRINRECTNKWQKNEKLIKNRQAIKNKCQQIIHIGKAVQTDQ